MRREHIIYLLIGGLLLQSACGKPEEDATPRPSCLTLSYQFNGREFSETLAGGLTFERSAQSPSGATRRFVEQPLLIAKLAAANGPTCQAIEVVYIDTLLPDEFFKKASESKRLYVDQIDAPHLLKFKPYSRELETPLVFQPGDKKLLILALDTTFFEPGTQGQVELTELEWRVVGAPTGNLHYLSRYFAERTGNLLAFNNTLVDVCRVVEEKIEALKFPLKGWTCGRTTVNFLVYAPEDLKSCRLAVEQFGTVPLAAEQISSTTEFDLVLEDLGQRIKCLHP